jgi:hypothetical protein
MLKSILKHLVNSKLIDSPELIVQNNIKELILGCDRLLCFLENNLNPRVDNFSVNYIRCRALID